MENKLEEIDLKWRLKSIKVNEYHVNEYSCNIIKLKKLPLRIAIETLEIIKDIQENYGMFKFSKEIDIFYRDNYEKYENEVKNENKYFNQYKNLLIHSLKSPVYEFHNISEYLNLIYDKEKYLNEDFKKINFSTPIVDKSKYLIKVANQEDLINELGKSVYLTSMVSYKNSLNELYKKINKNKKEPYEISSEIKIACFNEDKNEHEYNKNYDGKNYILNALFLNSIKHEERLNKIIELTLIEDYLVNSFINENNKKPKLK